MRLMKHTNAGNHFWIWFGRQSARYLYLPAARTQKEFAFWFDELQMHAMAYCKLLAVDLDFPREGKGRLVITTNGNKLGFQKAEQLVKKAPALENWTITALRQPRSIDWLANWVGPKSDIPLSKMWFQPAGPCVPDVYPIRVYVEYILPGREWDVYEHAGLMITQLLGEKRFAMNIELLEVDSLCNATKKKSLRPLATLPAFIAGQEQPLTIGPNGKLRRG